MSVLARCDGCGAVRWSLLRQKPGDSAPETCDICGTQLKIERRRPGGRFKAEGRERRDFRASGRTSAPSG
jgi:predicted nucleic acid-binding Zn ribbon protein